jgi:hypothetical protein
MLATSLCFKAKRNEKKNVFIVDRATIMLQIMAILGYKMHFDE